MNLERIGSAPPPSWLTADSIADATRLEEKPFDSAEYARRLAATRASLEARALDGILVFRPSSVDYLCGHHTVAAVLQPLLVLRDSARLYVPDDEVGRALASATVETTAHFRWSDDALAVIAADVSRMCPPRARIALEVQHGGVPPRVTGLLVEHGIETPPGDYLVERLRLKLSDAETECMERAGEITGAGIAAASEALAAGKLTDSDLAGAIAQALYSKAESVAAAAPIIATGPRGGITHSTFDLEPLSDGTTFTEFSGTCQRYHAPVMATFARDELSPVEARLERIALEVLRAVLAEARPGRTAAEVAHSVKQQALDELTDEDIFHFNFGYAVGLAHPPGWMDGFPFSIVAENESELEAGMAFHVPASLRCFGKAAVGLSHTIILDQDGARPVSGEVGGGVIHAGGSA